MLLATRGLQNQPPSTRHMPCPNELQPNHRAHQHDQVSSVLLAALGLHHQPLAAGARRKARHAVTQVQLDAWGGEGRGMQASGESLACNTGTCRLGGHHPHCTALNCGARLQRTAAPEDSPLERRWAWNGSTISGSKGGIT